MYVRVHTPRIWIDIITKQAKRKLCSELGNMDQSKYSSVHTYSIHEKYPYSANIFLKMGHMELVCKNLNKS